jgi:hypothetical protein
MHGQDGPSVQPTIRILDEKMHKKYAVGKAALGLMDDTITTLVTSLYASH